MLSRQALKLLHRLLHAGRGLGALHRLLLAEKAAGGLTERDRGLLAPRDSAREILVGVAADRVRLIRERPPQRLGDVLGDEQGLLRDLGDPIRRALRRLLEPLLGLGPLRQRARLVAQHLLLDRRDVEEILRRLLHLLRELVLPLRAELLAHLVDALPKLLEILRQLLRLLLRFLLLPALHRFVRALELGLHPLRPQLLAQTARLLGRLRVEGLELG